ncbi:hypothetical protein MHYP_G00069210 [Metynnis hypsauchen]
MLKADDGEPVADINSPGANISRSEQAGPSPQHQNSSRAHNTQAAPDYLTSSTNQVPSSRLTSNVQSPEHCRLRARAQAGPVPPHAARHVLPPQQSPPQAKWRQKPNESSTASAQLTHTFPESAVSVRELDGSPAYQHKMLHGA